MALGPGSIAFIGFNADGPDNLAFVALTGLPAGTVVHFTDNEWNGTSFNTGEASWSWTATADIAAGTVVTMDGLALGQTASSNLGTIAFSDATARDIGITNEIVYAYVGTPGAPTAFLSAVANDTFIAGAGSIANTGLTAGLTALSLFGVDDDADVAAYNGQASGLPTFADYLPLINDPTKWITQDGSAIQNGDGIAPDAPFGTAPFTIDPTAQLFGFASASFFTEEGDSGTKTFTFTVKRAGSITGDLTFSGAIALGTADGSDFGGTAPTTFNGVIPDGDATATFTIHVTGDTVFESNHDFVLSLTNASAPGANVIVTTASATATILDDEAIVIAAGETRDTLVTLDGAQSLTIEHGGTLENSIQVGSMPVGVVIDNAGSILPASFESGIAQAGDLPTGDITIINRESGVIRADQGSGAIIFSNPEMAGDNSRFVLDNAGLIENTNGTVIRLTDLRFDSIEIHNRETGQIIGHTANGDVIRAPEGIVYDGLEYVGDRTIVKLFNDGVIKHDPDTEFARGGDAIDFASGGGTVVNSATGLIEGSRHGITGKRGSDVENHGTIIGRNGSAINIDNDGTEAQRVHVVNYGTLQGRSQHYDDSDGDAIDTDGLATVDNYGTIEGLGHNGYHSGEPNVSEGLAIGGGTVNNYAGATIYGYGRAIQVDDSENGDAFAATTIVNAGLIQGDGNLPTGVNPEDVPPFAERISGGEAINLVGNFADTLTNTGTIIGGVKMDGGNDTLTNSGTMMAIGGSAIDMGAGDDVVTLGRGSTIVGTILLGDGNDVIHGGRDGEIIDGGAGDDFIAGGGGNDVMTGGSGADQFAFNGHMMWPSNYARISDLNFVEGDKIVLTNFSAGTFAGLEGGNLLTVQDGGSKVTIDSFADLRELDLASSHVSVSRLSMSDTLAIDVDNGDGHVGRIEIDHAWTAYSDLLQNGPAPDELRGTTGDDVIRSTAGDQTLVGQAGADRFVFLGDKVTGTDHDHIADLNFGEGDTISFSRFSVGTFESIAGGNRLVVGDDGSSVKVDSFADIAELDQASSAVSVSKESTTDTLVLTVTDGGGAAQVVHIDHAWAAYQAALI